LPTHKGTKKRGKETRSSTFSIGSSFAKQGKKGGERETASSGESEGTKRKGREKG